MDYIRKSLRWTKLISPAQTLLVFYIIAIALSTGLLSMPIAYKTGVTIPFIDKLFIAVSALSVTGLSPIIIEDTLSMTGIVLLAIILQLGAVGVMALGTFIWLILGKRIGLKERRLIMTDQNQTFLVGMVDLIKQIILVLFMIELISIIIMGTYFLQYFPTVKDAYLHGLFTTISAISNGGFSIFEDSLIAYKNDYFIQVMNMGLIILGAIGFPVLIEVKEYLFASKQERRHIRFSLFTKLTTLTFLSLIVVGTIFIYFLDAQHFFADKSGLEVFFYSLFQSVTTRSGGLSTLDVSLLTEENHLFMSFLMFIGASPSSAGGGIRTTTFALVVIFIITYARGGKTIRLFQREVYSEDLMKAVTVTLMAFVFVFSSLFIISIIEPYSLMEILFEVTSAFGTVGLSLGITADLTVFSKVILMFLMFVGRVGVVTFLFLFRNNQRIGSYKYPREHIIIG